MSKRLTSLLLSVLMILAMTVVPVSADGTGTATLTITPSITTVAAGADPITVNYSISVTPPAGGAIGVFSFTLAAPKGMTLSSPQVNDNLSYHPKFNPDGIFETFAYTEASGYFAASGTTADRRMTSGATVLSITGTIEAGLTGNFELTASEFIAGIDGSTKLSTKINATPVKVTEAIIPVTGVKLDKEAVSIQEGQNTQLTATVLPENASNKNVTWSTDNEAVASVAGGVVTAHKQGTANIKVTTAEGGKTATCKVTVTHVHDFERIAAVAATCDKDGNNEYYHCKTCGKYYKADKMTETTPAAETIRALGHDPEEVITKEPTCTEAGSKNVVCSRCGKVLEENVTIPALGHASLNEQIVKQPTCTEPGQKQYVCTRCQKVVKTETIPALGHKFDVIVAKEATCTEPGNHEYYHCQTCGKYYMADRVTETTPEAEVIPAHGHTLTKIAAKEATCTESGNHEYYHCTVCGKYYKADRVTETTPEAEVIPAHGHTLTKIAAKGATCTESGNHEYYHCAECGKYYKSDMKTETTPDAEKINALGHNPEEKIIKQPTCTEPGQKQYVCTRCQQIVKTETIPALGHKFDKIVAKEATCTESGNHEYYHCNVCGKYYKADKVTETTPEAEVVKALGHTFERIAAKQATCTEAGHNEYYHCTVCGKYYKADKVTETTPEAEVIKATGHYLEKVEAKEPTCTEPGSHEYYHCKTCGKYYKPDKVTETTPEAEVVKALGHTFERFAEKKATCTEAGHNEYYHCTVCGKYYKADKVTETTPEAEVVKATGHNLEKVEAKEPTCTEPGSHEYYHCKNCGKYFKADKVTETTVSSETIQPLGHDWSDWETITDPADPYYNQGKVRRICGRCGKTEYADQVHHVSTEWSSDADGHWHDCDCGEKHDYAKHEFVESAVKNPTPTEDGYKEMFCPICGYSYRIVLPATGVTPEPPAPVDPTPTVPEDTWENPFTDVSEDDEYYEAVKFVNQRGLFYGTEDGTTFSPEMTMTRGMFVTVLSRLAEADVSRYTTSSFADVKADAWYAQAVEWASENKIVLGYGDGNFGPNDEITVEQAAIILKNYAAFIGKYVRSSESIDAVPGADGISDWAEEQMVWAVSNRIYEGKDGVLYPTSLANRALVATMLHNFVNNILS